LRQCRSCADHESAAFIHGADAIGIAVGGEPEIADAGADSRSQGAEVLGKRLGMDAAETRIHFRAHLRDVTARALEEGLDDTAPRAVHRVDDEALRIFGDQVRVDESSQMIKVRRQRVELLDAVGLPGLIEIHQIRAARPLFIVADVDLGA
jgi:hypothetical protein